MNVLNKEYQQLEEEIQNLSETWRKEVDNENLTDREQLSLITQYPVIPQLKLNVNLEQYHSFIKQLFTLLADTQPALVGEFAKIDNQLTQETLEQWFKEAVSVNHFYIDKFAREHGLSEWLPFFVAEHALRPYLRKVSSEIKSVRQPHEAHGGCPACGESPRVAVIKKNGKKEVNCPRCLYSWEVKKIQCAHCGSEEPGKIEILKIEKEESAEIYVCHDCKGYTKVIDTRKLIMVDPIPLLDLKTIHLDFVAQENGFGIQEVKDAN